MSLKYEVVFFSKSFARYCSATFLDDIKVVLHIQCCKLFKGMECTVLPMVLCITKKTSKSFEIRVGHSFDFGLPSVAILP